MTDDYFDDEEVSRKRKRQEKIARLEGERKREALRRILGTEDGREYFWSILERCEVHGNTENDTNAAFRFLGRRDVGQELLVDVFNADPNAYSLMRTEAEGRNERMRKELKDG